MKKYFLSIGLIFLMLITSSCKFNNPYSKEDKIAHERINQIITLINAEDSRGLFSVFSEQAITENANLYDDIYKLIDAFSSNELSCQDDSLPSVTESNDYGVKETIYTSIYNVVSGEDKYVFYIYECTENTLCPEKIGVYTIAVFKSEDYEVQDFSYITLPFAGARFFVFE